MIVVRFPPITHFRLRILEWGVALVMLLWWVVLSQPSYSIYAQPSLELLARIGSEDFWAPVCFTIAVARLGALYVNGAWRRSPYIRAFTAFLSSIFWLWVSIGMAVTGATTGLAVYPVVMLFDWYSIWTAMDDADKARKAKKPPVLTIAE